MEISANKFSAHHATRADSGVDVSMSGHIQKSEYLSWCLTQQPRLFHKKLMDFDSIWHFWAKFSPPAAGSGATAGRIVAFRPRHLRGLHISAEISGKAVSAELANFQ